MRKRLAEGCLRMAQDYDREKLAIDMLRQISRLVPAQP
jgi:hypothetical protein